MEDLILQYRRVRSDEIVEKIKQTYQSSTDKRRDLRLLHSETRFLIAVITNQEEIDLVLETRISHHNLQHLARVWFLENTRLALYLVRRTDISSFNVIDLANYFKYNFSPATWDQDFVEYIARVRPDTLSVKMLITEAIAVYPTFPAPLEFLIDKLTIKDLCNCLQNGQSLQIFKNKDYVPGFEYLLSFPEFYLPNDFLTTLRIPNIYSSETNFIIELIKTDNAQRGAARQRLIELNDELKTGLSILEELFQAIEQGYDLVDIALSVTFNELKLDLFSQVQLYNQIAIEYNFQPFNVSEWKAFDYQL